MIREPRSEVVVVQGPAEGGASSASPLSIDVAAARAAAFVTQIPRTETVALTASVGRTLAAPFDARIAAPPFTQSAMDGYALLAGRGVAVGASYRVIDRVPAGRQGRSVGEGEAARIFTGAPLPEGADAVVMQERVQREGDRIVLKHGARAGDNLRPRGEDIDPPAVLLDAGQQIDARHVGLLASQGVSAVAVVARPRIAVISTGDELRQAGAALEPATIYDSNRAMLLALMTAGGFNARDGGWRPDVPEVISDRLRSLAGECDLIVTTGGASVGCEDHAATAVAMAGGEVEKLTMAVKPGRHAVVGRIDACAYLGLPGNPVAALVSWMLLGRAMVGALIGGPRARRAGYPMASASRFRHQPGRTEFAPARLVESKTGQVSVEILGRGGSARLRPLALADGLAEIAAGAPDVEIGDVVGFHPFSGVL